jgi:cell wall-associated NlpC family hydrolase
VSKILVAVLVAGIALSTLLVSVAATALSADAASSTAVHQIPATQLPIFEAAGTATGTPWEVLAAVAFHESSFRPTAVGAPVAGWCGGRAMGEMQFASSKFSGGCAPGTYEEYQSPVPPNGATPPSPLNAPDAIYAAGRYLASLGVAQNPTQALDAYSGGMPGYASTVLALAASYDGSGTGTGHSTPAQLAALAAAETQLGVPYLWGGESPGEAFDCSGLVQWAYATAGVNLPRVAQDQYDAGPQLGALTTLSPGDLVFFGGGADDVTHVGMYVGVETGHPTMINAPHTGTVVHYDTFDPVPGAAFGPDIFVGATAPGS